MTPGGDPPGNAGVVGVPAFGGIMTTDFGPAEGLGLGRLGAGAGPVAGVPVDWGQVVGEVGGVVD
jgi:hypothetical protein